MISDGFYPIPIHQPAKERPCQPEQKQVDRNCAADGFPVPVKLLLHGQHDDAGDRTKCKSDERASECYAATYPAFCHHVLGIPRHDNEARRFHYPADEIISRLSEGTGIPYQHLIEMTPMRLMRRLVKEAEVYLADPEKFAEQQLNNQV